MYFDKALRSWCDCTTREAKSQEITCLVLPWDIPLLPVSALYLCEVSPKSPPHPNRWGLRGSCHATPDKWIFSSGCPESINVNTRSRRNSRLESHQNEDPPFHNNGGKIFQVSSEIRISSQWQERGQALSVFFHGLWAKGYIFWHKEKQNWKCFWDGTCLQRSDESFSTHHCTMLHTAYFGWSDHHLSGTNLFPLRQFFPARFPAWTVSRWHLQ